MPCAPISVCHLTTVHPRYDVRILCKQAQSLARNGYRVSLLVADGLPDESVAGVAIHSIARVGRFGRLVRIFSGLWLMLFAALKQRARVYHFHDPELIPVGLLLRLSGAKVVYDVHEDVPRDIMTKHWIPVVVRRVVSGLVERIENFSVHFFDGVCAATPFIGNRFLPLSRKVVVVNNYPILGELSSAGGWEKKTNQICYIGGITEIRGIREVVRAIAHVGGGARLVLAGNFDTLAFERSIKQEAGWEHVSAVGWLGRKAVRELLTSSSIGLVTLHPEVNYRDSLPVKMFEYMAAGIPVIASDFPLWKEIIVDGGCGLCVDPLSPSSIGDAIDYLINNPQVMEHMGFKGTCLVREKYNWSLEEVKLLELYRNLSCGADA